MSNFHPPWEKSWVSHVGRLNPQTLGRTKLVHLLVCLWLAKTHLGLNFGAHCDDKTLNVHLFMALNSCQIWLSCRRKRIENLITYPKVCFLSTHHLSSKVSWFTLIQELGWRGGGAWGRGCMYLPKTPYIRAFYKALTYMRCAPWNFNSNVPSMIPGALNWFASFGKKKGKTYVFIITQNLKSICLIIFLVI